MLLLGGPAGRPVAVARRTPCSPEDGERRNCHGIDPGIADAALTVRWQRGADPSPEVAMRTRPDTDVARDPLTQLVIGAAIEVHRHLGPGLLESAYEECLAWELRQRGVPTRRQVPLGLTYKGVRLDQAYRIDLVVDERLIVEVKTVDRLIPVHSAQVLTYLRLAGIQVGLLLNFRTAALRDGVRRIASSSANM